MEKITNKEYYIVCKEKLPSLNEYIKACRTNKHKGAKFKRDIEDLISMYIYEARNKGTVKSISKKCRIYLEWHEKTKRRDCDNIQSAQKYILDALQKTGILINDSRKYVENTYHVIVDDDKDFVVIRIKEIE